VIARDLANWTGVGESIDMSESGADNVGARLYPRQIANCVIGCPLSFAVFDVLQFAI
jgi:hypothetical protein